MMYQEAGTAIACQEHMHVGLHVADQSVDSLHDAIAKAVASSIRRFASAKRSLSLLRNGGWEQTFRNSLLVDLEETTGAVGFTEWGNTGRSKRIDLVFVCPACRVALFGIETKCNFACQSVCIEKERLVAFERIQRMSADGMYGFYIHVVTDLLASEPMSELVDLHNQTHAHGSRYKRFRKHEAEKAITGFERELSIAEQMTTQFSNGGRADAVVRAWVARYDSSSNGGLCFKAPLRTMS